MKTNSEGYFTLLFHIKLNFDKVNLTQNHDLARFVFNYIKIMFCGTELNNDNKSNKLNC